MWKWIKVPKIGALVAFFLPWLTISCSGTPIVKATGWQLAFGGYSALTPQGPQAAHETNLWLILAVAAVGGGIWQSFHAQSKARSLSVILSSAIAAVLIWAGTARYDKSALLAEASRRANSGLSGAVDQSAAMMIQVTWEIGYWIAMLALIVTGVMAWLIYSEKEELAQATILNVVSGVSTPVLEVASDVSVEASDLDPKVSEDRSRSCPKCGANYGADQSFCSQDGSALEVGLS